MNYIIEGEGALVNEAGEETPLKAGDFALVNPSEKHQYRNKGNKPFKMICGVPKEFELLVDQLLYLLFSGNSTPKFLFEFSRFNTRANTSPARLSAANISMVGV